MNAAQKRVMELLREDSRRDIYEAAHPANPKLGSGNFYVTYSPNDSTHLSKLEVAELVNARLIREKWPGCYTLQNEGAK